jgi:OHCU decarboxylase
MAAERPFISMNSLLDSADRIWRELEPHDWLEAFHSHPKIGEKKAAATTSIEAAKWSEEEQAGTRDSAQETMKALAELNGEYHKKFGFIFIVSASGKSSEEMLAILRDRLGNDPETELSVAAAEQAKITELRLKKLIEAAEK